MDTLKQWFCRARSNQINELKHELWHAKVELEKKNIRIQRLLSTMKEWMVEHNKLLEKHEAIWEQQRQASESKIVSFVKSTTLEWIPVGPTGPSLT